MILGKGMMANYSKKEKIYSRTSTEEELIGVDKRLGKMIWTRRFIQEQGFDVKVNVIFQDNQSAIK